MNLTKWLILALSWLSARPLAAQIEDAAGRAVGKFTGVQLERSSLVSAQPEIEPAWFTSQTLWPVGVTVFMGEIAHQQIAHEPWYKANQNQHTFEVQNSYALGVDKDGHRYTGNLTTLIYYYGYRATGITDQAARWWAFSSAVLISAYSEYYQGFSPPSPMSGQPLWGSDWQDVANDALGAGLLVAQGYWPELNRIQLRWAVIPRNQSRFPYDSYTKIFNDYQGQIYYLTVRVVGPICLAYGRNLAYPDAQGQVHLQHWVSLDVDWVYLLGDAWWTQALNRIKLVVPAWVMSSGAGPRLSLTAWK